MLVARIVAALRAGVAGLDQMVAVTFTEKAAGEMKLRLRSGLETARNDPAVTALERVRLDRALAHLEVARIGTIHALCADVLREFPVEAGVDPLFEVMPEEEAEGVFEQSFEHWFQGILHDPPEGVRRVLRRRGGRGPREALRNAAWQLAGHRDFGRPWRREPFDREGALDAALAPILELGVLGEEARVAGDEYLAKALDKMRRFADELGRRERVRGRDDDELEADLSLLGRAKEWTWRVGGGGREARSALRSRAGALRDAARERLTATLARCDADLAACLQRELGPVVAAYGEEKDRAGKLDFLDLLLSARDLVRDDRAVREALQRRFERIFVDEFQDTDPLQAEILLLLAADDRAETAYAKARPSPGKLFVVGDPKQSIYRFRRADVALYESIKGRLVGQGASLLFLTQSFRSAPGIQAAVNGAFAPAMADGPDAGQQARYVPLRRYRDDIPGQPSLVALPVPRPYNEWGKVRAFAIKSSLPDAVGAFVEWLVRESGFRVTEREGPEPVPIGARHICLLFKRFQSFGDDLTRGYVRALEARHVPHVLVGGRSFYDREEVQAVRNALVAVEWPDDDLAVYATLRGPFFALSDDALLAYRDASGDGADLGPLNPLYTLAAVPVDDDGSVASVMEALAILRRLHLGRNRRPIADTLEQLLAATRAHAGIAIWPTGEQALANVLRVLDMARRFEAQGATSFRAFVERLGAGAESGTAAEAPVVEEGTEGVRIMTVHRAKGLEFPVVILADPTAPVSHREPTRHVDQETGLWAEALAGCMPYELVDHQDEVLARDAEETVRLAYVAATRARDMLVVPVTGDAPIEGWLHVLDPVLYPEPRRRRDARVAAGCPRFGLDSVLERPAAAVRDAEGAVMPGLHVAQAGTEVVWWDPAALDLGRDLEGGLRQQRILAADATTTASEEAFLAHEAWAENRAFVLARGATKAYAVRSVTEAARAPRDVAPPR
jgi:ATP-dependent exoDNAse (exonuclease V) beta subunit